MNFLVPGHMRGRAQAELDRRKRMVAMKEDAERDLLSYTRMIWPILEPEMPLVEGWLLDFMCDVLMAITFGELVRVCFNLPPGSTKSTMLNVIWPSWEWGPQNHPSYRYLSISYSTDVPIRDNLRFASIIKHPVYQSCWGDRVRLVRDGAEWVGNDRTGWKSVSSTGGGVTGFRGDRLLLDDLNNPKSVESEVVRDSTNKFVREIMPDRLNDLTKSAIINLQQRTHQKDATGTLLEHGQNYTFVCVPMRFDPLRIWPVVLKRGEDGEPTDVWVDPRSLDDDGNQLEGLTKNERGEPMVRPGSPMARAEGESCMPERFAEETLYALEKEKGPYAWDSQYQQYPGIRGGAIIRRDWWKLWTGEYPALGTVVVSVDTAVELGQANDYNACTAWGAFEGLSGEPLFLLLAAWRARLPLAQLVSKIADTCRERRADYLLIEHKTRGRDVHDEIIRLYSAATWQTVLVKPDQDKVSRLKAVSHLFSGDYRRLADGGKDLEGKPTFIDNWAGGVIYAPDRDWAETVITEVADFPYSEHDDFVDTVSQALAWCRANGVVLRKVEYEEAETARNQYRKPSSVPYSIKRNQ